MVSSSLIYVTPPAVVTAEARHRPAYSVPAKINSNIDLAEQTVSTNHHHAAD